MPFAFTAVPGTGDGTNKEGLWTCLPDFVCVAVGVKSEDSSELELSALKSLSLSSARLRFLMRFELPLFLRCRGTVVGFVCLADEPGVDGVTSGAAATGCEEIVSASVGLGAIVTNPELGCRGAIFGARLEVANGRFASTKGTEGRSMMADEAFILPGILVHMFKFSAVAWVVGDRTLDP